MLFRQIHSGLLQLYQFVGDFHTHTHTSTHQRKTTLSTILSGACSFPENGLAMQFMLYCKALRVCTFTCTNFAARRPNF